MPSSTSPTRPNRPPRRPRVGSLAQVYRTLHNLVVGTVALWVLIVVLAIGGLLVGKQEVTQIKHDEALALRALCTERGNYDQSIRATKAFLKTHPNGIPGISRAVLEQGLRSAEQARAALNDVNCS